MALSEDTKAKIEALGKNQRGVLDALASHGQYPGGWTWSNHSSTVKICESLVRRGLATSRTVGEGHRAHTVFTAISEISEDYLARERERSAQMRAENDDRNAAADRARKDQMARKSAVDVLIQRHEAEFSELLATYRAEYGIAAQGA